MSWRLRLMRNGPGQTIRRIGRAVTKAAQALTSDLIRSTTEDEQELEGNQARTGEEGCADVEEQRDQSGDGDRAETDQEDDSEEGSENSDTSTVGTSAKIRLRRQHKKRFYQGRDDVYAHQYVYRILAEAGIYQQPRETTEGECNKYQTTTFTMVETTLSVLRAMRALDAKNRGQLMTRVATLISSEAQPLSPGVLYR